MLPEKRKPASGKTGSHEMMIWTDQSSEDSGAVLEKASGSRSFPRCCLRCSS